MSECPNDELRDLLPDLAADRLSGGERTRVASHVASCRACATELALLTAARRVMSQAPAVDVARIVAALPKPPSAAARKPVLVASGATARPPLSTRAAHDASRVLSSRTRPRSWWGQPAAAWRIAAVAVVAVGTVTVAVVRHRAPLPVADGGPAPAGAQGAASPVAPAPVQVARGAPAAVPAPAHSPARPPAGGIDDAAPSAGAGLAVGGDISELSDGEVESLLQDMNGLDAQPSADPDAADPAMSVSLSP